MLNVRLLACVALGLILWSTGCSDDSGSNTTEPEVSITFPEEGQILTTSRVNITGTAAGAESIEVNGVTADVLNGEWEVLVPFDQGEVTVTAVNGKVDASVSFVVDSLAPSLVITSPERGEYVDQEVLKVEGNVTDGGTGLAFLEYGGQRIEVDAAGNFSIDVPMRTGLNRIRVAAQDLAGNEANSLRGVMYGDVIDPTQKIDPSFAIFVREEALATVETVVEQIATPEFVTSMVADRLMFDNVAIDAIRFDPIDVQIDPQPSGAIDLSLYVTNAEVEGSFTIGQEVFPTTVTVRKFDIQLEMRVSAGDDGGLKFDFGEAVLNVLEEDLLFTIQDLTQDDAQFLRNLIVDVATQAFGQLLNEALFEELFDPNVLKRRIEILGRVLVFELAFENIQVFSDGILARLSVTMPEEQFADVRDVPGALNTPVGNPQGPSTTNDIIFTTTRNAMDRILHGVWRSGLLHQELKGQDFGGIELPFELNSSALSVLLDPDISSIAGQDVPASIGLRPLLPPVLELSDDGGLVIKLDEAAVDLKLLPAGGDVLVATIAVFLTLEVDVQVEGLVVKLNFDTDAEADLAAEPEIDLDDDKAEGLLESLVALVPQVFSEGLEITGEADITWLSLETPEIEVHGVETDHVSISLKMVPNPAE